jgi:radical SAM superfamily enzyme YgiQ (UPF0313 family)
MLEAVIPRYDLIRFGDYIMLGMQYIRGCPFNCEFCDVIELYGRIPRFKSTDQIIRELQYLYDLGYRGHIDMVDDNFIGNKRKVKELLQEVKKWTIAHHYPFYFSTEASVNLADDDELLQLMKDVDFRYIFLGIETPEHETLILNQKTQNINRSVEDAILKFLSFGLVINGGYIIGFDSESPDIAERMISSIQGSGVCMTMVGLLYALPHTQLTQRLESEGRLFHIASKSVGANDIDQMTSGLNFKTLKPRAEILKNYIRVIDTVFQPSNYYKRVVFTGLHIKPGYKFSPGFRMWLKMLHSFLKVCRRAGFGRGTAWYYWRMFFTVLILRPKGVETAVNLAAMFLHFRKQKEYIVEVTGKMITELEKTGEEAFNSKMLGQAQAQVKEGA